MPTILAIDTSSEGCSVAIRHADVTLARYLDAPRQHTQKLLPMIDELLSESGLTLAQLDAIAYGRGPGSFTGLRICLGIAQGLAFAADKPLLGVSSLLTMAQEAAAGHDLQYGDRVLVAIDARMGEVYWCLYEYTDAGMQALLAEQLTVPQAVPSALPHSTSLRLKVGSGCLCEPLDGLESVASDTGLQPQAEFMLDLAAGALARGEAVAAEAATLTYLRDSVAWQKRERIRNN